MKKFKLLIIFFVLFILTGCSVDYDLVITDNRAVIETVNYIGNNQEITTENDNIGLHLDEQINSYKSLDLFKRYNFSKKVGKTTSSMTMKRTYPNLTDYEMSPVFRQIFEGATIIQNSEKASFTTVGAFAYGTIFGEGDYDPGYTVNLVKVRVKFFNEVTNSNADIVDKTKNIYEWHITPNTTEKSVFFEINNKKRYDVIIMDYIINNKTNIIIIGTLVVAVVIAGLYLLFKLKKSNKV